MAEINLDFCIIENPLDKNKKPIIFITRKGRDYLDETVIQEEDYEKVVFVIQNIGYIESDILTFEYSQDPAFPVINIDIIKETLLKKGLKYSDNLELTIKSEFDLFNLKGAKQFIKTLLNEPEDNKKIVNSEIMLSVNKNSIYKIPEIGQYLTLYFNLFVECKFSGDKCFLNLNGDFTSKKNTELRNFITPFRCDFIRINNNFNPNKIILKSCQINKDILKKLPIDFNGSFTLKIQEQNTSFEKLFVYYLMEVKNNFPVENRITIEIDSSVNFDKMIVMSKKIKQDYDNLQRKKYSIVHLESAFDKIKTVLEPKMLSYAEMDEFEKALKIKKDINHINNKLKDIQNIKVNRIEYFEFIKKFHIN